jgi:hypothetical protein
MTPESATGNAEMPKEMTPERWLAATFALLVLLVAVNLLAAWRLDVFGILRDPTGRELVTSEHERKAKYLLNQAYVPANYDALVIGASASLNWRVQDFTGYRFYNESLEGGDASEERKLVEQALPRGHFRVALVGLYPRITALHLLQDGFDRVNRSEVVGSISSFGVEYDMLMDHLRHRPKIFYPNGSHELPVHAPPLPGQRFGTMDPVQDPQAIEDYRALVKELMDRGTRIVYVSSPLYQPNLEDNQELMDHYTASILEVLPKAPVIDFNAPEYVGFRSDPANYIDGIHLSALGADRLSRILNVKLQQALGDSP